jgi:hypothetical protein
MRSVRRLAFISLLLLLPWSSRADADDRPRALTELSQTERCSIARLVATTAVNLLEWMDLDRYLEHDAGALVIVANRNASDGTPLLFKPEEACTAEIRLLRQARTVTLRLVNGPAPQPAKPYINFWGRAEAHDRFVFVWPMDTAYNGYLGKGLGPNITRVSAPFPTIEIEIARKGARLTVVRSELRMWTRSLDIGE